MLTSGRPSPKAGGEAGLSIPLDLGLRLWHIRRMAEFFDALDERHVEMIGKQPVFFVATAAADGRINLSPKGYDSFRVLSPGRVGYLDLGGSGNETHAHLSVDGRVTFMFCNFEQPAQILRIYGRGRAVLPQDAEWDDLVRHFQTFAGTRQIILADIDSVQTSCGWGVPFMSFDRERETLKKAHAGMAADAWMEKTQARTHSIDGIPTRMTDRYFGPID